MIRNIFYSLIFIVLTTVLWLEGCNWLELPPAPTCQKENTESVKTADISADDKYCTQTDTGFVEYKGPFRHRWWHYYKRAMCFAEKGCWDEAIKDLKIAIDQRGEDQWDARTYGMHFTDYFPRREMGIAYYYLGKVDEAKNKLEASISQTPTEKALVYLERSYGVLIKQKKIEISKPNIFIIPDTESNNESLIISGVIGDNKYIREITVNDEPVFLMNTKEDLDRMPDKRELSKLSLEEQNILKNLEKQVYFIKQIPALHGMGQRITVKAQNVMGKDSVTLKDVPINVDKSGPVISVHNYSYTDDKKIIISGCLMDDSKISDFSINGNKIPIPKDNKLFCFRESVEINADKIFKLASHDKLGNKTEMISNFKSNYDTYPIIKVKNLKDEQAVYVKSETLSLYKIEVDIEGNNIKKLSINNNNILGKQGGNFISLNYEINLQEDTCIEAIDENNKRTIQKIRGTIVKKDEKKESKKDDVIWIASRDMISQDNNMMMLAQGDTTKESAKQQAEIKGITASIADPFSIENRLSFLVLPFYSKDNIDFQSVLMKSIIAIPRNKIEIEDKRFKVIPINDIDQHSVLRQPIKLDADKKTLLDESRKKNARCCIVGEINYTDQLLPTEIFDNLKESYDIKGISDIYLYKDKEELISFLKDSIGDDMLIIYEEWFLKKAERSFYYIDNSSIEALEKRIGAADTVINKLRELLQAPPIGSGTNDKKSKIFDTDQDFEEVLKNKIDNYKKYKDDIFLCAKSKYTLSNIFHSQENTVRSGYEYKFNIYDTECNAEEGICMNFGQDKQLNAYSDKETKKPQELIAKLLSIKFQYVDSKIKDDMVTPPLCKDVKEVTLNSDIPPDLKLIPKSPLLLYNQNAYTIIQNVNTYIEKIPTVKLQCRNQIIEQFKDIRVLTK